MIEPGDLVEMIFDKKAMNFNRYRQAGFLEGVAVVISGPHEQRIGPMNSTTYEIRFQTRNAVSYTHLTLPTNREV